MQRSSSRKFFIRAAVCAGIVSSVVAWLLLEATQISAAQITEESSRRNSRVIVEEDLLFADHDCRELEAGAFSQVRWAEWFRLFEGADSANTWMSASVSVESLTKIQDLTEEYAAQGEERRMQLEHTLEEECPMGMLTFYSLYLLQCTEQLYPTFSYGRSNAHLEAAEMGSANEREARAEEKVCFDIALPGIRRLWNRVPLRILIGSQWPFLSILSSRNLRKTFVAADIWADPTLNCWAESEAAFLAEYEHSGADFVPESDAADESEVYRTAFDPAPLEWREEGGGNSFTEEESSSRTTSSSRNRLPARWPGGNSVNWVQFQRLFFGDEHGETIRDDWYVPSLRYVWHYRLRGGRTLLDAQATCPLGVNFVEMLRAMSAMTTESAFFPQHERRLADFFVGINFEALLFSRWPFFMLINHIRRSNRHKFHLQGLTRDEVVGFGLGLRPVLYHTEESLLSLSSTSASDAESKKKISEKILSDETSETQEASSSSPADFLRKMSRPSVSNVHRAVVEALMRMPDVWVRQGEKISWRVVEDGVIPEGDPIAEDFLHVSPFFPEDAAKHPAFRSGEESPSKITATAHGGIGKRSLFADFSDVSYPSAGFCYATMAYGASFTRYMEPFVRRFKEVVGKDNLVIFTMQDGTAQAECTRVNGAGCIPGNLPGIMNKFTIPWLLVLHGVDVVWVDFDVYFFQNPTPYLLEHQNFQNAEILITGSFATHCICSGIVYFRATEGVRAWLVDVLHWMYDHPYEHDQKCFAAWLDHTERVNLDAKLPRSRVLSEDTPFSHHPPSDTKTKKVPQWGILESVTQFVTAAVVEGNGWMGASWRDVVLFHFLHGDSDKEAKMNYSGGWLKNSTMYKEMLGIEEEEEEVFLENNGFSEKKKKRFGKASEVPDDTDVSLMELFYGPKSTPGKRLAALERSRQREREELLDGLTCGPIALRETEDGSVVNADEDLEEVARKVDWGPG